MEKKFKFPLRMEDLIKESIQVDEEDELLEEIIRFENESMTFNKIFEEETFLMLLDVVINSKNNKKSAKIFQAIESYLKLALDQLNIIESMDENLLKRQRQDLLIKKNFIKYSIVLSILLLQKNFEKKKNTMADITSKKSKKKIKKDWKQEVKLKLFSQLIFLIEKLPIIYEEEAIEPYCIKHCQNLVFKALLEIENFEQLITNFLQLLLKNKNHNLENFKTNFIYTLDDTNEKEKIYQYLGKLLSLLLDTKNPKFTELVFETIQKLINKLLKNKSDHNFSKNSCDVITMLSLRQPGYIFHNFSIFRSLYGCDNYCIRNCISELICTVIKYLYKRIRAGEQNLEKSVSEFFRLLCCRNLDKTASCRISMMKCLNLILAEQKLELEQIFVIVQISAERVFDVSSLVRKRSLVMCQALVMYIHFQLGKRKDIKEEYEAVLRKLNGNLDGKSLKSAERGEHAEGESMVLEDLEIDNDKRNLILEKKRLKILLKIHQIFNDLIPKLKGLLYSKNQTDILESLKLVYLGNLYKFEGYFELFSLSFNLIWVKENVVKEELLKVFFKLYIEKKEPIEVVEDICYILKNIDQSKKICLEEIIKQLYNNNRKKDAVLDNKKIDISKIKLHLGIIKTLWNYFINNYQNEKNIENGLSSLYLLRLGTFYHKEWILNNVRNIYDIYKEFIKEFNINWKIVEEFVNMFIYCHESLTEENKDMILKIHIYFLLKYQGCMNSDYLIVAEKIIHLIFILRYDPEILSDFLLKRMAVFLDANNNVMSSNQIFDNIQKDDEMDFPMTQMINENEESQEKKTMSEKEKRIYLQKLIHLIFISGEISLKFLYFIEKIDLQLQKRKQEQLRVEMQDELQQVMDGPEAEYENQKSSLTQIIESIFQKDNLLFSFVELTKKIIYTEIKLEETQDSLLFTVSINTLIKFMILNTKTAQENLPLLYDLLKAQKISEKIKSNIIIGIGDLFHRYPNLLNPKIRELFSCLKSTKNLKRTTITVLSHLILNDYVKIKAEIADFVLLLDDEDASIVDNAKIFFFELNQKDPLFINNILPDAISRLSREEDQGGISEISFEKFSKYILQFVDKVNLIEKLIEKLVLRLRETDNEKEIRNVLICVYHLSANEKNLKKLVENADILRRKLNVPAVGDILKNIILKYRKNYKIKKGILEEFEKNIFSNSEEIISELRNKKMGRKGRINKRKRKKK